MTAQKPTGAHSSRARSKPPEAGQAGAADGAAPPNTEGAKDLPQADAARDEAPITAAGTDAAAPAGGEPAAPPANRPAATLVVTGPARGRWRAGRHFTAEPTTIPHDQLTEEDLDRLLDDPELTVHPVAAPY